MDTAKLYLDKALFWITAALLACMAALSMWQVTSRYVLGVPSSTSEEIIRFMLIWFTLLATAYVFGEKQHIALEFLREKFNKRFQKAIDKIISLLWISLGAIPMLLGGIYLNLQSFAQTAPATDLPMVVSYLAVPTAGLFIIFYAIHEMVTDKSTSYQSREDTL
ncbi:TRAP transporter small permease [Salicibibacter halophilus]|uniref:TRAP transporter small permease n=1 Tax=Salicibibacter halophilus TaxID=2502791 RepID=A0A514LM15_9BACI|nr:TRAP transporter small permease [Salicibibacter halophilus]QDI92878.1 TRAP transporter small permease [Salicibibacter halophilus]